MSRRLDSSPRTRRDGFRSSRVPVHVEALESRRLLSATDGLRQAYGQLPLSFEANRGQTDSQVQFLSRGAGYALFVTPTEAVLSLQAAAPAAPGAVLRMRLVGANATPRVVGLDQLPGTSNYLTGNDPSQWHTNIPNYARVESQGVYPGVDLIYHGNQRRLEYDFTVAPGTDPGVIRLAFQGAASKTIDAQGNLVLHTAAGDVVEQAPVLYQESGGARQAVSGHYMLRGDGQVGFAVGAHDRSKPLVIDPILGYSTYLGGSGFGISAYDQGSGIAVDSAGNAYITGFTRSTNFPTKNPLQEASGGNGVPEDAFVSKLNADGSALLYSTYLGGSGIDEGYGIAVDGAGNAYVTGVTGSFNFPTKNPLQPVNRGSFNAFVSKLNPDGSALLYSTYLGGNDTNGGHGIAVDSAGNAYVTGDTRSTDFPTTPGARQRAISGGSDAFVSKLNPDGSALLYSTYLGGSGAAEGLGIAVDGAGNAYVVGATTPTNFPTTPGAFQPAFGGGGDDAFVSKLNPDGSALLYSTYLGGSGDDDGRGIAVDAAGNAYVTGNTTSANFPTKHPLQSANGRVQKPFVSKLNPDGSALLYSTYLGGRGAGGGIAVDAAGNAYITGATFSTDFPTTPGAPQGTNGGGVDAFVSKLNADGSALLYSTYLGGSDGDLGDGIAVDAAGNAYITGWTLSGDFPTTPGAPQGTNAGFADAFVTKIAPGQVISTKTTTTLRPSLNPSTAGQPVTFTATVTSAAGAAGTPTGRVTFVEGTRVLGSRPLVNGQATFTTASLAVGRHAIRAVYGGDVNFVGSQSSPVIEVVNRPVTPPPVTGDGPRVVSLQRFGFHWQPTLLVLSFSTALDAARAQDVANYRIIAPSGRTFGVDSAEYDPATRRVLLVMAERLNVHRVYRLVVNGTAPGGLTDTSGRLLDGRGNGVPGSDFVATIDRGTLAGPASSAPLSASAVDALAASGELDIVRHRRRSRPDR